MCATVLQKEAQCGSNSMGTMDWIILGLQKGEKSQIILRGGQRVQVTEE